MRLAAQAAGLAVGLFLTVVMSAPAAAEVPRVSSGGFDAPGFELPDMSAWTLRAGELEVAPEALRLGIAGFLQVGSYYPLDALGALNAEVAATLYSGPRVAVGARAGFLYFNPDFVGIDTDFEVLAFPLALELSVKPMEELRIHGALQFLSARPENQATDAALRIARAIGPVGRMAFALGGEYRLGRHFALLGLLELPIAPQREALRYAGEGDGFGDAVRASLALHMVFESFNLRLGGGYGPSWLGKSGFFPVVALSVRVF